MESNGAGTFVVRGKIKESKKRKGIRATLYRQAEKFLAFYHREDGFATYCENDLHVCAAFKDESKAMQFQTFLGQWGLDSPLLLLQGKIEVEEEIFRATWLPQRRVMLVHYNPHEADSPLLELADLQSSTTSIDSTVDLRSEEFNFQRLEDEQVFLCNNSRAYTMHIKGQARFKDLRSKMYNRLAGSWCFHQNFDGLHTLDRLPGLAIRARFEPSEDCKEVVREQERTRVELVVDFRSEDLANTIRLKHGSERLSELSWGTFVHVQEPKKFRECLEWKHAKTERIWRKAARQQSSLSTPREDFGSPLQGGDSDAVDEDRDSEGSSTVSMGSKLDDDDGEAEAKEEEAVAAAAEHGRGSLSK